MQLQVQGPLECIPTSIAMIYDRPKNEILDELGERLGASWSSVLQGLVYATQELEERFLAALRVYLPTVDKETMLLSYIPPLPKVLTPIRLRPGKTRGWLTIRYPDHPVRWGHCLAFEGDTIYDPKGLVLSCSDFCRELKLRGLIVQDVQAVLR